MRIVVLLTVLALLPAFALAADKRVYRIDSLIATRTNGVLRIQAKGAVQSGGWKNARLHVLHSDKNAVTAEFVAAPPAAGMTVIEALVPVEAETRIKARAPSVHVVAEANEMTTQVLH